MPHLPQFVLDMNIWVAVLLYLAALVALAVLLFLVIYSVIICIDVVCKLIACIRRRQRPPPRKYKQPGAAAEPKSEADRSAPYSPAEEFVELVEAEEVEEADPVAWLEEGRDVWPRDPAFVFDGPHARFDTGLLPEARGDTPVDEIYVEGPDCHYKPGGLAFVPWMFYPTVNNLAIPPLLTTIELPKKPEKLLELVTRAEGSGKATPLGLSVLYNDLAAAFSEAGGAEEALRYAQRAAALVEDAIENSVGRVALLQEAPPPPTVAYGMIDALKALAAVKYGDAKTELYRQNYTLHPIGPFPVGLQMWLMCKHDAAFVRHKCPQSLKLYERAWTLVNQRRFTYASDLLLQAATMQMDNFFGTDVRWPLAAMLFDLGLAKVHACDCHHCASTYICGAVRIISWCNVPDILFRNLLVDYAERLGIKLTRGTWQ